MKTATPTTDLLTSLAESYLLRMRSGEDPSVDEYVLRHPESADEIRELFATLRMVEQLGDQSRFGGKVLTSFASIPSRLGDFQLMREVARGGMGIVFEAFQIQLGRRVAIKVLPPSDAPDVSRRLRFQREARAAANLHHTNIVPVFEVGEQDGICFYAMQFIEGETLAEVWLELRRLHSRNQAEASTDGPAADPTLARSISQSMLAGDPFAADSKQRQHDSRGSSISSRSGPTVQREDDSASTTVGSSPRVASIMLATTSTAAWTQSGSFSRRQYFDNLTRIMLQVVDALTYAHSRGVLHRDIKPSNIILDTQCCAWLTDFGLARMETDEPSTEGNVVGTLRYMSPERFTGHVDARDDVYSVGLMLYEFATLRPTFQAADHAGMMRMIQHVQPIRPRECDPTIPKDLETIILSAIEKNPVRRYATADALAADLRRFLDGRPLLARRASRWEHAWRWCRRNPGISILSGLLACVIVGALITTFFLWRRAESSNAVARTNLDLAVAAVDQFCTKVSDDIRLKEHDLRPLRRDLLTTAVDFHQELLTLRGKSNLARVDLARSFRKLAQLTAEIEANPRAISLYQQAIAEYEELLRNQPDHAETQIELAVSLGDLGQLLTDAEESDHADKALERSVQILTSIAESRLARSDVRSQLARSLGLQASVMQLTRRFDEAQAVALQAVRQLELLTKAEPASVTFLSELTHAYVQVGEILLAQGISNWSEAESEFQKALSIQRRVVTRADSTDFERRILAGVLKSLGRIKRIGGQSEMAMEHLRESAGILEALLQEQPSVLSFSADLATTYIEIGQSEDLLSHGKDSEVAYRKASEILDRLITKAPGNGMWESHLANALWRLGKAAGQKGDSVRALSLFDRSVVLLDSILIREPQSRNANAWLPDVLILRGKLLAQLDRCDEALADCDRAVNMARDEVRDLMRLERSWVLICSGDYLRAAAEARESLQAMTERCNVNFLLSPLVLGAKVCGRAAALAMADETRPAADRKRLFEEYSGEAVRWLRTAIDTGLDDPAELAASPEFESLRDIADFVALWTDSTSSEDPSDPGKD